MMDAIAGAAMNMSAAQVSMEYAMKMVSKVMDTQEMAAQEVLEMLPETPPLGDFIDTYA